MAIPAEPIRREAFARLTGHAATSGYTWATERHSAALPFGMVSVLFGRRGDVKESKLTEDVIQIDYWTVNLEDADEALTAIDTAMESAVLDLSAYSFHHVGLFGTDYQIIADEPMGEDEVHHALVRYRLQTQDTS